VSDLNASTESYRAALAPLRYEVLMNFDSGWDWGQHRLATSPPPALLSRSVAAWHGSWH
jgi:hypothetical protein